MTLDPAALARLTLDRAKGAPVRRRRWRGLILLAVGLLLLAAVLLRPHPLVIDTVTASAPEADGRTTVLNASGYVVARRLATVASKVTGRIVEIHVEEGLKVTAGEVLARLDDATARAAWRTAARSAEASDRALTEIEVRLADAERALTRADELAARHLIAQSALDTTRADRDALKARLAAATADAAAAKAAVAQRQQDLEDLVIRAPFTGVAISKDAQVGEMVSPISAGGGFTRTGIATLVDMDSRELEVDVNEAYIQRVHDGQAVEATLDAYPDAPLPAHVLHIVPTADRQKATIKVRLAIDHLEDRILPDMGIKVRFLEDAVGERPKAVAVLPRGAVVNPSDHPFIWVLADGSLHRTPVTLAPTQGDDALVASGITAGATVAVHPENAWTDGARAVAKSGP
jgi:RND family efflux transporter MFP subunit